MNLLLNILLQSWNLLLESSVFILFGLLVSGLLRVFLNPGSVSRHLGRGRFKSVFKASLLGIPIPLCSCGVLPAAAALKKQGASNGAVTSFLISTPESGVDSIAITYALMDPIMTVVRPVAAFFTAFAAGITENLLGNPEPARSIVPDLSCPVDGCCDGKNCSPEVHRNHHRFDEKISAGFRFAFTDVWGDLAVWFLFGLLLSGIITVLIPESLFSRYMGGGFGAMLIMLGAGIPIYICATASTPIAATLILQGVSPGAALVFLMTGPATNAASLTVLVRMLGKRATGIYLAAIAICAVGFGLLVDWIYAAMGVSARSMVGQAGEAIPHAVELTGAILILVLSVKPVWRFMRDRILRPGSTGDASATGTPAIDAPEPCAGST
ncbi:SO_0444 family Cu/Zn efflux transporter [uncultured Desulfosarcina sp.]|uniref:SO_0444 family Cu/Zn efflux transporter n=1 Tax=uncultured Desulfosarcina sp. TaxID=218289 RepID=UPI0029C77FD4|nr:SO_0444 family Cu/Zn efflux transporter [uncultured Desulfosarcina sp.]